MALSRNQMTQLLWPHLISTSYGRPIEQWDEDEDYGPGEVEEEEDPESEDDEDGPGEGEEDDVPEPKTGLLSIGNIGQFVSVGAAAKTPAKAPAVRAYSIATPRGPAGEKQTSNDIQAMLRKAAQEVGLSLWIDPAEDLGSFTVRFAGAKPTSEDAGKLFAVLDAGMEWWAEAVEGNSILTIARISPLFEGRRLLGVEVSYSVKNT